MTSKKNTTTFEIDNTVYPFEQFEEFECTFGSSPLFEKWGVKQAMLLPLFSKIIVTPATVEDDKKKSVKFKVVGRRNICEAMGIEIPEWGPVWTFFGNPSFDKKELKASVGHYLRGEDGELVVDPKGKKVWVPKETINGLDAQVREALYWSLKAIASDLSGKQPVEKVERQQR